MWAQKEFITIQKLQEIILIKFVLRTFEDKVEAIKAAQRAGMSVCSGGIMGIGETMEDRIDMALEIRNLNVNSVPINRLNPIPGTSYEHNKPLTDEYAKNSSYLSFYFTGFIYSSSWWQGLFTDKGKACLQSGANAVISGDMLTTSGISIDTDMKMIQELGFKIV